MGSLNRALFPLASLAGLIFVAAVNFKSAPVVLADEWIYRSQIAFLPFSEHEIPNYLYSWIYSFANVFGDSFYLVTQLMNAFFFFAFCILIYWVANQYIDRRPAMWLALATLVSPLNLYVGLNMPEVAYFAFIAGALGLYVKSLKSEFQSPQVLFFLASIAILLVGAFIKPHATFFAVLLSIHFLWRQLRSGRAVHGVMSLLGATFSFLGLKLAIGFAIAGQAGLTIFGTGYEKVLLDWISTSSGAPSSLMALPVQIDQSVGVVSPAALFNFEVLVASAALVLAFFLIWQVLVRKEFQPEVKSFSDLLVFLAIFMLIVVIAFQVSITFGGDDHTQRLLLRHLELLAPFFVIPVLASWPQISKVTRAVGIFLPYATGFLLVCLSASRMLTDSTILFALAAVPWLSVAIFIAGLVLIAVPNATNRMNYVALPTIVLISLGLSFAAQQPLAYRNLQSDLEVFTEQVRSNTGSTSPLKVYSTRKQDAAYFLFMLNRASIGYTIIKEDDRLELEGEDDRADYALIGNIESFGETQEKVAVGVNRLLSISGLSEFDPGERFPLIGSVTPTPSTDAYGFIVSEETQILLRKPISPGATVAIGLQAMSDLCGPEELLMAVNGEAIPIPTFEVGTIQTYLLNYSAGASWSKLLVLPAPGCRIGITSLATR